MHITTQEIEAVKWIVQFLFGAYIYFSQRKLKQRQLATAAAERSAIVASKHAERIAAIRTRNNLLKWFGFAVCVLLVVLIVLHDNRGSRLSA